MVLGYSNGGRNTLHPICAQRLTHAAEIATEDDVVVLSGWARKPGIRPEAELMAEAWTGRARELVVDPDARSTVGNATNAIDDVRRTGVTEVVVVTSRWHVPRALAAFRWLLRGLGTTIVGSSPPEPGRVRERLLELARWVVLPLQLAVDERQPIVGDGQGRGQQRLTSRSILTQVALLLVGAVSLYLIGPTLLEVLGSWNTLTELEPSWLILIAVTQLLALACLWALQRLAIGIGSWRLVITSQLAANAASRLIPGGAATGTAVHFRLLRSGGIGTEAATTGLAVAGLLQVAMTLALPAIALPAVAFGTPAPPGLLRVAWAGGGLFVLLVLLAVATLADDRLLRSIGRLVDSIRSMGKESTTDGTGAGVRLLAKRDGLLVGLHGSWAMAVGLTAARSTLDYLSLVVAMVAVGGDGRLSLVLLAYASATLLGLIPVTPGGLGFVEAGLTGTLVLAGISATDAIGIALVYRLFSFWLPLPAGLLAGIYHHRHYR